MTRALLPDEYVKLAVRTEAISDIEITPIAMRRLHAIIGLCTEVGELQDHFKQGIWYNNDKGIENLKEELGDILWYIALFCDTFKWSLEEIMVANIEKLKIRYPEKFTEEKALNRDLEAEKETLK